MEQGPSYDVVIVGCGPVGSVLATLLGQRGRSVLVVERHERPYPLPRAVHFDHEVGRILQACGLGDDLPRISEPGSEYEWRNGTGQVLLRFGGRPVGPSGWPDSSMFWQPALERLVEQAAAAQPSVTVERGRRVVALADHGPGGGVALSVEPPGGGATEVVTGRYVVGCDGAGSTVRDLLGVAVTDLGFFYDWLIVDLALHEPRVFDPVNVQVCEPGRPTTVVSGGPGRRRWEFMRLPGETIEELDDADRAWELLAPWDVTPDDAVLERHAVYRFQARWADRWRVGNVLLAGDAAHQMPPFAGQGLCSGVRDAANLAWKLDLVLAGRSHPDLLDAYEVERTDNVRAVIDLSMALGRVICITDPVEAAERDAAMAAGAAGGARARPPLPGIVDGIVRADDAHAGSLFVQGRVAVAGAEPLRLDDVVGAGWRLVAFGAAAARVALDAELAHWFAALGGEVVRIDPAADVDGTYAAWFAAAGVAAVLQRPDFHVFGSAAGPDDVGPLVADLRAAVAPDRSTDATRPTAPIPPGGTPS